MRNKKMTQSQVGGMKMRLKEKDDWKEAEDYTSISSSEFTGRETFDDMDEGAEHFLHQIRTRLD